MTAILGNRGFPDQKECLVYITKNYNESVMSPRGVLRLVDLEFITYCYKLTVSSIRLC